MAPLPPPPSVPRSVYKEKNEVAWSPVPLETLLDVESIVAYWRPRGLVLHRTPSLRPFPDLTQPETAFPQYPLGSLDPNLVVRQAPGAPCTSGPGAARAHYLAAQGTLERGTCLECRRATERASSGFFPRGASCALPSNLARTRRFNHPSCRQVTHPHVYTHDSSRF